MAEGRDSAAWNHTAELLAMMVNAAPFRDPKARLAEPTDFHPYARKPAASPRDDAPLKVPLAALLPLFAGRR